MWHKGVIVSMRVRKRGAEGFHCSFYESLSGCGLAALGYTEFGLFGASRLGRAAFAFGIFDLRIS